MMTESSPLFLKGSANDKALGKDFISSSASFLSEFIQTVHGCACVCVLQIRLLHLLDFIMPPTVERSYFYIYFFSHHPAHLRDKLHII